MPNRTTFPGAMLLACVGRVPWAACRPLLSMGAMLHACVGMRVQTAPGATGCLSASVKRCTLTRVATILMRFCSVGASATLVFGRLLQVSTHWLLSSQWHPRAWSVWLTEKFRVLLHSCIDKMSVLEVISTNTYKQ